MRLVVFVKFIVARSNIKMNSICSISAKQPLRKRTQVGPDVLKHLEGREHKGAGESAKRQLGMKLLWKTKRKSLESEDSRLWQRVKDSNPHIQSQSLLCYHYTNPLFFCLSLLFTAATDIIIQKNKEMSTVYLKNF